MENKIEIEFYYLNYNSYYKINFNEDLLLIKNPHAVFFLNKIINTDSIHVGKTNILKCIEKVSDKSNLISFFYEESFYNEQMISLKDFSIENEYILISTINNLGTKILYNKIKKYLLKIKKKHLFFKFNIKTNQLIIYIYYDDFYYKIICYNIVSYYYANESFRNELWNPRNTKSKTTKYQINNISKIQDSLFMKFVINKFFEKEKVTENFTEYLIADDIGEDIISVICSPDIQVNKLNY